MVVGGIANLVWGVERTTFDIDITVWVKGEERITIDSIIEEYDALVEDPYKFVADLRVLPIKAEQDIRVDIIFGALPFEKKAIERAVGIEYGGAVVKIMTAEDLVIAKVISERPKDRDDAKGIIQRQGARLVKSFKLV